MHKISINFCKCQNIDDLHNVIKKKFNFDEYYGKNLDALYDSLTSLSATYKVHLIYDENQSIAGEVKKIINVLSDIRNIKLSIKIV